MLLVYCRMGIFYKNKGTSKNIIRHAELVSASPNNQGIAGQARNDERMIIGIFRSPHNNKQEIKHLHIRKFLAEWK